MEQSPTQSASQPSDINQILSSREQLSQITEKKRIVCSKCQRPERVCICHVLPSETITIKTKIIILQTKAEAKAKVKTADIVALCVKNSKIVSFGDRGDLDMTGNSVLLFPSEDAKPIDTFKGKDITLIVLDGTWNGARRMLSRCKTLQSLPKAIIPETCLSTPLFKARKAPRMDVKGATSTAEAIASAIDNIEGEDASTATNLIRTAVHEVSEFQLRFIREKGEGGGRHRTDRKGYIANLYNTENKTQ